WKNVRTKIRNRVCGKQGDGRGRRYEVPSGLQSAGAKANAVQTLRQSNRRAACMGEATARVLARGGGNSYEVETPTCHLLWASFFERAFLIGATAGSGRALFSPGRREADPPGARPLFRADGSAWRHALRRRTFRDQLSRKREGPLGGQPKLVVRFLQRL